MTSQVTNNNANITAQEQSTKNQNINIYDLIENLIKMIDDASLNNLCGAKEAEIVAIKSFLKAVNLASKISNKKFLLSFTGIGAKGLSVLANFIKEKYKNTDNKHEKIYKYMDLTSKGIEFVGTPMLEQSIRTNEIKKSVFEREDSSLREYAQDTKQTTEKALRSIQEISDYVSRIIQRLSNSQI